MFLISNCGNSEIYIPLMSSRFQILRTRNLESSTWNPESTDCHGEGWDGVGGGRGIVRIQVKDCHKQLLLAVSGSRFKTWPYGDVPLDVVWFFAPLPWNCELYQGLDPIRGSMIWHARLASIYEQSQIGGLYLNLFKELLKTSIHFREP